LAPFSGSFPDQTSFKFPNSSQNVKLQLAINSRGVNSLIKDNKINLLFFQTLYDMRKIDY